MKKLEKPTFMTSTCVNWLKNSTSSLAQDLSLKQFFRGYIYYLLKFTTISPIKCFDHRIITNFINWRPMNHATRSFLFKLRPVVYVVFHFWFFF